MIINPTHGRLLANGRYTHDGDTYLVQLWKSDVFTFVQFNVNTNSFDTTKTKSVKEARGLMKDLKKHVTFTIVKPADDVIDEGTPLHPSQITFVTEKKTTPLDNARPVTYREANAFLDAAANELGMAGKTIDVFVQYPGGKSFSREYKIRPRLNKINIILADELLVDAGLSLMAIAQMGYKSYQKWIVDHEVATEFTAELLDNLYFGYGEFTQPIVLKKMEEFDLGSLKKLAVRLKRREFPVSMDGNVIRMNYDEMNVGPGGVIYYGIIRPWEENWTPRLYISLTIQHPYTGFSKATYDDVIKIFEEVRQWRGTKFVTREKSLKSAGAHHDNKIMYSAFFYPDGTKLSNEDIERINNFVMDFFRAYQEHAKVIHETQPSTKVVPPAPKKPRTSSKKMTRDSLMEFFEKVHGFKMDRYGHLKLDIGNDTWRVKLQDKSFRVELRDKKYNRWMRIRAARFFDVESTAGYGDRPDFYGKYRVEGNKLVLI